MNTYHDLDLYDAADKCLHMCIFHLAANSLKRNQRKLIFDMDFSDACTCHISFLQSLLSACANHQKLTRQTKFDQNVIDLQVNSVKNA
ncbi:hypothetical protein C7271_06480 [filamentous cyanobacterium CCP5]|nr:hypothetical protein C7271_06480 [filamentous cyanobacterium CCP5]